MHGSVTLKTMVLYLADSGTNSGVNTAKIHGAEVTIARIFQSANAKAINGKADAAAVKKIAIDIFATNVRHFGPTYSRTNNRTNLITS